MAHPEVEEKFVDVDAQGRMILPSRLRERLGLKNGGRVSIRLENSSRVVIEPKASESVEERAENWVRLAQSTKARVLEGTKRPSNASSKWMSKDYARRKLGL